MTRPLLQELAKTHVTQLINPSHADNIRLHRPSTRNPAPDPVLYSTGDSLQPSLGSQHSRLHFHPIPFYESRTLPYWSYPSVPACCLTCSPSPSLAQKPNICACWSKHTAFSSTCTCWRFPHSLFLVNKSVKEMAESLFYGRNHIWVLPRGWDASRKLEIWIFLTWVRDMRRHLRNLAWEMSWSVREE
jgi:hypothetical protein